MRDENLQPRLSSPANSNAFLSLHFDFIDIFSFREHKRASRQSVQSLHKIASRQRGVCVKHLNRCKTSTVTFSILILACVLSRDFKQRNFHICACLPGFANIISRYFKQRATVPFISPWPTKLLMFGEDMQSDQLHVPAIILIYTSISTWDVANPKTTMPLGRSRFDLV